MLKKFIKSSIIRIAWILGILELIPLFPIIGITMVILTLPMIAITAI